MLSVTLHEVVNVLPDKDRLVLQEIAERGRRRRLQLRVQNALRQELEQIQQKLLIARAVGPHADGPDLLEVDARESGLLGHYDFDEFLDGGVIRLSCYDSQTKCVNLLSYRRILSHSGSRDSPHRSPNAIPSFAGVK